MTSKEMKILNMNYIKTFESFQDIKSEINDILAYLSDDNYRVNITNDIKRSILKDKFGDAYQTNYLIITIDKSGYPFKLNDIKNDISNLLSMIEDRYTLYSITITKIESTSTNEPIVKRPSELMCSNIPNAWNEIKDEIKSDISYFKLKFTDK